MRRDSTLLCGGVIGHRTRVDAHMAEQHPSVIRAVSASQRVTSSWSNRSNPWIFRRGIFPWLAQA